MGWGKGPVRCRAGAPWARVVHGRLVGLSVGWQAGDVEPSDDLAVVCREVIAPTERDGAAAAAAALPRPGVQRGQLLPLLDHLPERENTGCWH